VYVRRTLGIGLAVMSRRAKIWLLSILGFIVAFIIFAVVMTNAESARMREDMQRDNDRNACQEWSQASKDAGYGEWECNN
jgi:hypothetical protein